MEHLDVWAHQLYAVANGNRHWMGWNLLLAFVPAVLALVLFARPHRRTAGWWIGVAVFTLFLPNAPYVVTDLIHLREDIALVPSNAVVVAGVLPLYAAFIAAGFLAYLVCTELVAREIRTAHPEVSRWSVEVAIHLVAALGIVLGRIARLNSWDTITAPTGSAERIFTALTWRGAPGAFAAIFLAVWLTHVVVRTLAMAGVRAVGAVVRRGRLALSAS